jgi:hypothetical protein
MSDEDIERGSSAAGEEPESQPGRKARAKLSAEEKRALQELEYRKKMALVEQTLPSVETAFSRQQSPLFGGSRSGDVTSGSELAASGREVRRATGELGRKPNPASGASSSAPAGSEEALASHSPAQVEHPEEREPVASRSSFMREGNDPNREAVYENLATQLRESKKRREALGGVRLHVRVSADVFSAVSELAFAKRLDKVEIVTFLLRQHLPKAPYDVVPKWMVREGEDTTVKEYALPYLQDAELEEAFRNMQFRFQLYRVDILEAIVLRYLPAAKGLVRPKRKVRARVVSKLGAR